MATVAGSLIGGHGYIADFFVSAAIVAGQVVNREPTATDDGEVQSPTGVTSALDCVGIAQNAATSDTTPATDPRYDLGGNLLFVANSLENLVRVEINPFAIYRFPISGSATAGTALVVTTTTPAHILTNDTAGVAGAGLITDTATGTINMEGGLVKGRTGNNVGQIRKIDAQVNDVSTTAGIGFVNAMAVGDTFIRVPFSRMIAVMEMTTNFVEANGIQNTGTGANFRIVAVHIDEQRDVAFVDVVASDHWYNPESA
jgi:hypothetical protein